MVAIRVLVSTSSPTLTRRVLMFPATLKLSLVSVPALADPEKVLSWVPPPGTTFWYITGLMTSFLVSSFPEHEAKMITIDSWIVVKRCLNISVWFLGLFIKK